MRSLPLIAGALYLLIASTLSATVINVPGDYTTIQGAIDASVDNDTVLVADGSYIENIDFNGKAILLTSQNGPEYTTIHIQTPDSAVVTLASGEGSGSILSGFTIEGDSSYWGVFLDNASAIIYNNIITGHKIGIRIDNGGSPLIRKNEITLCHHAEPFRGSGIRMADAADALIDSNVIHHNYSDIAAGIFLQYCTNVTVRRNLIYSNTAAYLGGLQVEFCDSIYVYNNTLEDNEGITLNLGSINISDCNYVWVFNNISVFNEEYGFSSFQNNTNLFTGYNDFYGNSPGNYLNWSAGTGSISADPLFADQTNDDFSLTIFSPCLNTGDPSFPMDPDGTIIDMGAIYFDTYGFGYGSVAGIVTDTLGNPIESVRVAATDYSTEDWTNASGAYVIDSLSNWIAHDILFSGALYRDTLIENVSVELNDTTILNVEMHPGSARNVPGDYPTIQTAIDASFDNETVLVDDGTYIENIDFLGKAITVISQNGPEYTTIQIQTSGSPVVTFNNGEGPGSILSGFTIEGNMSWWGIYINNTSPTIYNNIIKEHEVGIRIDYGNSPLIRKNEITLCSHSDQYPHNGGAIRMILGNNAVIDSNEIHGNYSDVAGAIYLNDCSNVTVERNLIYSNSSIYIGGLEISDCGNINVYNNTFVGNTSLGPQYILGAINVSNSGNIAVKNNISAFNHEYGICNYQGNSSLVTAYNDVYGNSPANYYNWSPGTGSISTDPLFVDLAYDNFYLDAGSPCINAGDPARPYDPDGTVSDMGALFHNLGPAVYGSLAGTVSDTSGSPIENANVAFVGWDYEDWTDVNGEYFIDSIMTWPVYNAKFSHPDFIDTIAYGIVINPDSTTILDITMKYPGSITGTVTDSAGPIPGVYVEAIGTGINCHTDINGEYQLDGLNSGFHSLSFAHALHMDTIITDVPVYPNDVTIVDVIMRGGTEADILIMYGNPDGSPITAPLGARMNIDVYMQTADDIYMNFLFLALGLKNRYFDSMLSLTEGQVFDSLTRWELVEFHSPSGSPPNPHGWSAESIVGYRVIIEPDHPHLICPTPTKVVSFVVRIPYDLSLIGSTVSCLGPGLNPAFGGTFFEDTLANLIDYNEYFSPLHFVHPGGYEGTLEGTVSDDSQQPIPGVLVEVVGTQLSDITDGYGSFSIDNIVMGTYDVSFIHPSYCDTILSGVSIAANETTTVNVIMGDGGNIVGTVTDPGRAPIEGVIVNVEGTDITDTTDSDGVYFLGSACSGLYDVSFNHPDYVEHVESDVEVIEDSATTLNVTLWPPTLHEAEIWYGSPYGSPTNVIIGDTLEIDVYIQTASDIHLELIHLALGSEDQYFTDLLSRQLGQVHNVLLQWDNIYFLLPDGSPPNPVGWSNQSLKGINDLGGPPNPILNCPIPTKIATYMMEVVNNLALAGDTLDCLGPGINPANNTTFLGDSSGVLVTDFVEHYNPFYFIDPSSLGAISGTVTDSAQFPIEGVTVTVQGTGNIDTTNGSGQYSCEYIVPGTYSLSFYHPDYLPLTVEDVEIIAGQVSIVDATLYETTGNCDYVVGDVNSTGAYNGLDITYGVNFFKGGPEPLYSCECTSGDIWYVAGDVNNSCNYNGLDITYGVGYFKGGPDPLPCALCPPTGLSFIRKSQIESGK